MASSLGGHNQDIWVSSGISQEGQPGNAWMVFTEKPPHKVFNRLATLGTDTDVIWGAAGNHYEVRRVRETLASSLRDRGVYADVSGRRGDAYDTAPAIHYSLKSTAGGATGRMSEPDQGTSLAQVGGAARSGPRGTNPMSTDAIVMLREDHKEVKRLFRRFEKAEKPAEKQSLVKQILEMLAVHTYIENEGMYPRVRKLVPDIESDILESYEEHHVADLLCAELAEMSPDDERFTAKTTVLIESVEHHIEEEETAWFPTVREALGRNELKEIGAEMIKLRRRAPRQPKQTKSKAEVLTESKPAKAKVPAQAAAEGSRAALTAPALPGVRGSIEGMEVSMPGAKTQNAARERVRTVGA